MMFSKAIVVSSMAIFAAASARWNPHTITATVTITKDPAPAPTVTTISQCNTGKPQCCNTVGPANTLPGASVILGLLGIVLQDVTAVVGLGCTPISVIGVGNGANCAQQPVCCTNNNFNGVINIGCTPISL